MTSDACASIEIVRGWRLVADLHPRGDNAKWPALNDNGCYDSMFLSDPVHVLQDYPALLLPLHGEHLRGPLRTPRARAPAAAPGISGSKT